MTHIRRRQKPLPIGKYLKLCIYAAVSIHLLYQSCLQFVAFGATVDYHHYVAALALLAPALLLLGATINVAERMGEA